MGFNSWDEEDFDDFIEFEKFHRTPKTGKGMTPKKDQHIKDARRQKEKAKAAALEEIESVE